VPSVDPERVEGLLRERAEVVARSRAAVANGGINLIGEELAFLDNHPADIGSETHEQEMDETTAVFLDEEERRISEARRALASGTYGICRECGREIPAGRLEAVPEAVRCLDCQRHFEGEHRLSI
jgi:RNA polymerase-binding transcription factor DksA